MIRQKRREQPPAEFREFSRKINDIFLSLSLYLSSEYIHCYISSFYGEVDTTMIMKDAWSKGKHVVVPITDSKDRRLIHSEFRNGDRTSRTSIGVLEPQLDVYRPVELALLDVVVIPGLAFDSNGGRIGFGGGYYDKFVASVAIPKVALAISYQLFDELPLEEHDVRMNMIVTEDGVIDCRTKQ